MKNYLKIAKKSFAITQDHLDDLKCNDDRLKKLKKDEGYNVFFKLYDDDDTLYYSGYLHEDEEDEFAPLDWAMADSGCTDIKYRGKDGKFEIL
tara:strand:- start:6939 stop:7217 length:279 start_codon:yes stop_codon:yes gene_type:complete